MAEREKGRKRYPFDEIRVFDSLMRQSTPERAVDDSTVSLKLRSQNPKSR
jgi:hypothetical protein